MKTIAKAFGGSTKAPKIKTVAPPPEAPATPMPDPEAEKRAAMRAELMRRNTGRQSTLLSESDNTDKL
jgi:hypothetical protein